MAGYIQLLELAPVSGGQKSSGTVTRHGRFTDGGRKGGIVEARNPQTRNLEIEP